MDGDPTLLAVISGAIGYGLRTLWDSYVKHRDAVRLETWKIRAAQLERRLSEFYWPIYLRLQRDNVIWQKILHRFQREDEDRQKLAVEIEKSVIIPNHIEIARTIYSSIHLANADEELETALLAYLRHVDVYTSIRSAGIYDRDPIVFEEPWPSDLFKVIKDRLLLYQAEYDKIVSDQDITMVSERKPPGVRGSRTPGEGGLAS